MYRYTLPALMIGLMASSLALAADVDNDGIEDAHDVCCQTPPNVPVDTQGRPRGDVDFDCDVDLYDFAGMQQNFTGPA